MANKRGGTLLALLTFTIPAQHAVRKTRRSCFPPHRTTAACCNQGGHTSGEAWCDDATGVARGRRCCCCDLGEFVNLGSMKGHQYLRKYLRCRCPAAGAEERGWRATRCSDVKPRGNEVTRLRKAGRAQRTSRAVKRGYSIIYQK